MPIVANNGEFPGKRMSGLRFGDITRGRSFRAGFRVGLGLLFVYVSLVPHRYLFADGLFANGLSAMPAFAGVAFFMWCLWSGELWRELGRPEGRAVAGWQILLVVGAFGAVSPTLALSRSVYYFLTGVLYCFVVLHVFTTPRSLRSLLYVMFGAAVVVALYGLYEFWTESNPLWGSHFVFENPRYNRFAMNDASLFGHRIRSTVGHPVYTAAYLLMFLPLGAVLAWHQQGVWRIVSALGVAATTCALFLTFSRGAWISALMVGLWSVRRRFIRIIGLAGVLALLAAGAVLGPDRIVETVAERLTPSEFLGQRNRFRAYTQVTDMVLDRPLLGIGMAHYRSLGHLYKDYDDTPDNNHLRMLAENGIAGLSAFIVLMGTVLVRVWQGSEAFRAAGHGLEQRLCTAVLMGLSAFLIDMVTCDGLYFPLTRISFWTLCGCGLALARAGLAPAVPLTREPLT